MWLFRVTTLAYAFWQLSEVHANFLLAGRLPCAFVGFVGVDGVGVGPGVRGMVVGTRVTAGVVLRLAGFIVGLTSAGELGDSWEFDEGSWAPMLM